MARIELVLLICVAASAAAKEFSLDIWFQEPFDRQTDSIELTIGKTSVTFGSDLKLWQEGIFKDKYATTRFSTKTITDKHLLKEFSGLTTISTTSQILNCPKISYKINQGNGKLNVVSSFSVVKASDRAPNGQDVCAYSSETENVVPSGTSVNLKVSHYTVKFDTAAPLSKDASVDFFFRTFFVIPVKVTYQVSELSTSFGSYSAPLDNKYLNLKLATMLTNNQQCPAVSFKINDDNNDGNAVTNLGISSGGYATCQYIYKKGVVKNGSKESMQFNRFTGI